VAGAIETGSTPCIKNDHGDAAAIEGIIPEAYTGLLRQARHILRHAPASPLEPADLVHEVCVLLLRQREIPVANLAAFHWFCHILMRRTLADECRRRRSNKRGSDAVHESLDLQALPALDPTGGMLSLATALDDLKRFDRQRFLLIELRLIRGMTVREISAFTQLSPRTTYRELAAARQWIQEYLS